MGNGQVRSGGENMKAMTTKKTSPEQQQTPEAKLKGTYSRLFHEIQFRATKNALMNYHQAEIYENKDSTLKRVTAALTGVSASGILAGVARKGQLLASKLGMAGVVSLPVLGITQLLNSTSSELLPSYTEKAKKHTNAAAGWMQVAELAKAERMKMKIDPSYSVETGCRKYEELIQKKEEVSKLVLIPRDTHRHFSSDVESVYFAMKKRNNLYRQFKEVEEKQSEKVTDIEEAEDIYF